MTRYRAKWVSDAAVKAAATKKGWDEEMDVSPLEYVEPDMMKVYKEFGSFEQAVALAKKMAGEDDFWAATEVVAIEKMPRRCAYCICQGEQETESWDVTSEGIVGHNKVPSLCEEG